jgi:hypothetical protein
MKRQTLFALLFVIGMLLAACAPVSSPGDAAGSPVTSTPLPPTPAENQVPVPQAAVKAQEMLAAQLGASVDTIQIRSIEQVQWPNACLGAQKTDEMCAEVIVDGYRVILAANGQTYEFHTNQAGDQVRAVVSAEPGKGPETGDLPAAAVKAREALAAQLGVRLDEIKVVSVDSTEWANGCLGVEMPGKMCTQVITPGYRVVFEVGNTQYEYHTDEVGGSVILATVPLPQTAEKVLTWQQTENGVCSRVEIGFQSIAFGTCGGTLTEGMMQQARSNQLAEMYAQYANFSTTTKSGDISLNGVGQQQPSEAEQRALAEWAKLVFQEAQTGRGGAAWGLAIAWHREGGIAGFCDDLGIYLAGWAQASSCKTSTQVIPPAHMTAEQIDQLYQWVDRFASFDYTQADNASADAMKVTLSFIGQGTEQATPEQQRAIADFAAAVYQAK